MDFLKGFLNKQMSLINGKLRPAESKRETGTPPPIHRRAPHASLPPASENKLMITCPDPSSEDTLRDAHFDTGQRLARQERWDVLISKIEKADARREMTPGAMPISDLLAYGARADVIHAAEHVLLEGTPARDAPVLDGIEALEHVLADFPQSYVVAAIVAQTHMDIAWSWRGTGWTADVPPRNLEAFEAHFDRASDILTPFLGTALESPFLAATACALLGGTHSKPGRIANLYETLIDLNPLNPQSMRAMGNHLLPRWHGSYAELELEARRTASRTTDIWGAGGYTWVQFDAITGDDTACANLDLGFFIEGLRDILTRRPDPYTANLLAAYCANAIGPSYTGNDEADYNRVGISGCAHWIVRNHLTELHPMIWAHAARGFDNNLRVVSPARFAASGRDDAMRIITNLFSSEIDAGQRIIFTDEGPVAST
ncbi:MAG: hypothetical protein AAF252_00235 [Pseudomonadota bacterium]